MTRPRPGFAYGSERLRLEGSLVDAALSGDMAALEAALAAGASPESQRPIRPGSSIMISALGAAVRADCAQAVEALVEAGADMAAHGQGFIPPIVLAADDKGCAALEKLLDLGADPKVRGPGDGRTLLICAAIHGNLKGVKMLVARGADLNELDDVGQCAVVAAVVGKSMACARWLVEGGAEPPTDEEWERWLPHMPFKGHRDALAAFKKMLRAREAKQIRGAMKPKRSTAPAKESRRI